VSAIIGSYSDLCR